MRPAISHTELYSYLVTRHTGRTVRASIERELESLQEAALAVLDLRNVPLIDFSCADEVVAKLVVRTASAEAPYPRFVLFRGIAEHHLEPIQSALARQGLVAAAESVDGEPLLIGSVEPEAAEAWREIWALGQAGARALADRLTVTIEAATLLLEELESRALVIRDGEAYLSLQRALLEAQGDDART